MKKWIFSILMAMISSFMVTISPEIAKAQVEVPEEELARESVLPRFERGEAVKNRAIVTEKKVEIGAFGGWNFTEPIYSQAKIGFNAGYHFTEESALMLNFGLWLPGRNKQYTDAIQSQTKANNTDPGLDFNLIPDLQYSLWANWELLAYYGKMSVTKQGVSHMHLYPILGLGMTKYATKMYPGLNFGLGQKFYFSKAFALRIDFKLQYQQGINPFNPGFRTGVPDPNSYSDRFTLGTILELGVSFLL
ncbi:MAG: hypothetical protein C5B49_08285 [Bdellovibrio sp.]|nr:MAG: hypothetical protein C5B49_08285 [Bdellovibrio sp.]